MKHKSQFVARQTDKRERGAGSTVILAGRRLGKILHNKIRRDYMSQNAKLRYYHAGVGPTEVLAVSWLLGSAVLNKRSAGRN